FQKVRRDGKAMRTIRRRLEFTLSTGTKAMDLHQLSHALFASMNATRRKLTPDTWPAIGALHLIENRLEVNQKGHITEPAARLQWTSSSRLPRSMLAIAECFARGEHMLKDIELTEKRVRIHRDLAPCSLKSANEIKTSKLAAWLVLKISGLRLRAKSGRY